MVISYHLFLAHLNFHAIFRLKLNGSDFFSSLCIPQDNTIWPEVNTKNKILGGGMTYRESSPELHKLGPATTILLIQSLCLYLFIKIIFLFYPFYLLLTYPSGKLRMDEPLDCLLALSSQSADPVHTLIYSKYLQ